MDPLKFIERAFSQAEYAINITDIQGTIIQVNEAYLRLYKFESESDIVGKTQRIIRSLKTPPKTYQNMWETILEGKTWRGELTNQARDDTEVFVHLTISPLRENGEIIGFMGFSLDRKQQVILERQLFHANKLVVLGTLGASLAHELNNPLTSILLETEFIRELFESRGQNIDYDAALDATNSVMRGVERMRRVLEHLLVYSRKDSMVSYSTISTRELVEDSFLFMEKQLTNRGIRIELNMTDNYYLHGNKTQLESVVHNLLTNSRDAFEHRDGGIKKISISTELSGPGYVMVVYRDNAGGIPPENMDKIWDPFFTTKSEDKGTGLGLAISRKILQDHSGSITCESDQDSTTFYIRLPMAAREHKRDHAYGEAA